MQAHEIITCQAIPPERRIPARPLPPGEAVRWNAGRAEAQHMISQPEQGRIIIEGPHGLNQELKFEDMDLTVHIDRQQCEVRFDTILEIPAQLANWNRVKRAKKCARSVG